MANLPYSVATPVISNLLLSQIPPSTLVVTIQKELAHRIVARPGTKDYGSLSVWVQSQCDTELVRELGPTVFWPRPKVSSAIVKMVLDPQRREALGDLAWFQTFVRTLFLHRRKFLRGALVGGFKQLSKPDVDQVMGAMSLPADARAEQLSLKQIQDLSRRIGEQIAHVGSAVRSPTAD